jgi:hypothetical protein
VDKQEFSVPLEGGALVGHRGENGRPAVFLHGGPAMPDYMGSCAELTSSGKQS